MKWKKNMAQEITSETPPSVVKQTLQAQIQALEAEVNAYKLSFAETTEIIRGVMKKDPGNAEYPKILKKLEERFVKDTQKSDENILTMQSQLRDIENIRQNPQPRSFVLSNQ